jgi:DNA mismatch repair protein MutS
VKKDKPLTPMMQQWHQCKENSEGAILLFRMGDFYEAFHEDAKILAHRLNITLTMRQEIPMSGIPHHSSSVYIQRLLEQGLSVAIAEQMEDPKEVKGLLKREVVKILSPGSYVDESFLEEKSPHYFAALTEKRGAFGLSFIDLSTFFFKTVECERRDVLLNTFYSLQPKELLICHSLKKDTELLGELKSLCPFTLTTWDDWQFDKTLCSQALQAQLSIAHLEGFSADKDSLALNAAGVLVRHLKERLKEDITAVDHLVFDQKNPEKFLDRITISHLELMQNSKGEKGAVTLLSILDQTLTSMGGRLLRNYLQNPLRCVQAIIARQEATESLVSKEYTLRNLRSHLEKVSDIERLIIKVISNKASPRDVMALVDSYIAVHRILEECISLSDNAPLLNKLFSSLHALPELCTMVKKALVDTPPLKLQEGNYIKEGFYAQLDELRLICLSSKQFMANYQEELKVIYDIKTLKVSYNSLAGYFIEVSKGQAHKLPSTFERRQTLVNSERFITEELKQFEYKVLSAEEKMASLEKELFEKLLCEIRNYKNKILETASALSQIDVLQSFALVALENNYVRPLVDNGRQLHIIDGRHPVVEQADLRESFVTNDTHLDGFNNSLIVLTGPNMGGKSTYLRQNALIVILAQMGCFVPAKSAHIGVVDHIFTRIGAKDDLARGKSTFMVEMTETAAILNNATERSLILLDEIGRGTSTLDGVSIAWSVAEYLIKHVKAKTFFATHYFELTELEDKFKEALNYHVATEESQAGLYFLRKIQRGAADKSYGIYVAKLAGLPLKVIENAERMLLSLENEKAQKQELFSITAV